MYVEVLEKAALEKAQEIMRLKAQKFDEYISGSRVTQPLLRSGITKQRERSYAQAAMASAKASDIKTNHVVILEPRNADMPTYSDTTFKLFKTSVNHKMLKDSKISIQNKKMSTKARVVLTCASQEQCEALCEAVSDDKWIKAVIPKKKDPQIQILGIDESIPKDDVFKLILAQNKDMEEFAQCKFEANFEKMDRIGTKFVVAEVEPKLFKKLIEIGKVCVGYSSCPVKSRIRVVRCFKCNRFGHLKKNCRNETSCTSCGGNHGAKVCKNPVLKCSNCDWINTKRVQRKQEKVNSEHRADDYWCPQYLRMYKIVENQEIKRNGITGNTGNVKKLPVKLLLQNTGISILFFFIAKCKIESPFLYLSLIHSINSFLLLSNNGINLLIISILFFLTAICKIE
ncbi:hypothetical protein BLOT_016642 [Blomia tropicalis]|nr:hypothetical protein BLOT_016642 [Blomia tropicalis]